MFVKFENIVFRNILSYGNNDNVVEFEPGMTLISGKNGFGKCLRGNTNVDIFIDDLIVKNLFNRTIKPNLQITVKNIYDFYQIYPEYLNFIKVNTRYGYKTIECVDITSYDSKIIRVETNSFFVETSPEHNLLTNRTPNISHLPEVEDWTKVQDLNMSDYLYTTNGLEKVNKISELSFREDLYDLQVADVHEFYANGIVSHNSTIIDSLSFCLYGKPYRKIKINDLINRRNKKKLYTECNFSIEEDKYKIVRTLLPSSIQIWKNGVELEKLSSKKLNQEEINKLIGIDHNLFRQIIALSINYNKAFLALEIAEKRDIIESIFNIKIFAEMLKKLKTNNTNLKVQGQVNISQLSILESTIKTLKTQIQNIERTRTSFDSDKEIAIAELESRFKSKEKEYKDLTAANKKIKSEISNIETLLSTIDFSSEVSEVNSVIKFSDKQFNDSTKQLELLNDNTICPFCKSELTEEHKNSEIVRLENEIEKSKTDIQNAKTRRSELAQLYQINETNKKKIVSLNNQYISNKNNINYIKEEVTRIVADIEKEKNRIFNFDDTQLKNDYDSKKNNYTEIYNTHTVVQDDLKYNDFAINILSDQGIKAFFFKKLVPILNKKVNHYLDMFELPIEINFNDMMEEYINLIGSKENIPYMSFSEGEKKRIDIAIMLSFIDTTKVISNWNCNLLAFDEILDSSTDSDGLDKIMGAIKQMTIDQSKLCCYIISHRDNDHENYTRKIIIKKNSGFSSIMN